MSASGHLAKGNFDILRPGLLQTRVSLLKIAPKFPCSHLMLTLAFTVNTLTPDTYREGDLNDQDVEDWLHKRDRFAPPSNALLGKEEGSIRLLICERLGFHPLGFGLSKTSLLAIENEFGLPIEMLPMFKFNGGSYSCHFRPLVPHDQKPEQLGKADILRPPCSSHLT
jgi:hypothetical protein